MADAPFWQSKALSEMSPTEWESLCDGCAKCCLLKLEHADTGEVVYTDVVCRLLDNETCRCTRYSERARLVPDCVVLDAGKVGHLSWMPSTCAYRLVAEGRDLPWWHHLRSGDRGLVHLVGASVRDRTVREDDAGDLADHIVAWTE